MLTDTEAWMGRALELAERGRGLVEPNPLVGAVVVRDGQVVGEGWHQRFGQAHAEVNALAAAGGDARSHAVRHAGAVLPSRQDAALHRRRARPAWRRSSPP